MKISQILERAGDYEYGTVQINLDDKLSQKILDLSANIPDSELTDIGRETTPHITVRYGLIGDPHCAVEALSGFGKITAVIRDIGVFPGEDNDVIVLHVEGDDLHRANELLGATCEYAKSDFPTYKPHITLAYVRSGAGKRIAAEIDLGDLKRRRMVFDTVMVSDNEATLRSASLL